MKNLIISTVLGVLLLLGHVYHLDERKLDGNLSRRSLSSEASPISEPETEFPSHLQTLYASQDEVPCGLKRPIERQNVQIDVRRDCSVTVQSTLAFQEQNSSRSRSFTFFPDGQMMVFIGTNDFPQLSRSTGSRTFTFLPRSDGSVQIYESLDGSLMIITASGVVFSVDPIKATLTSINGYEFRQTQEISSSIPFSSLVAARGGVEILPAIGSGKQLVDYGWRTGDLAYSKPGAIATWYGDALMGDRLNSCKIMANLLFKVEDRDNLVFKYSSDADLAGVLLKNCTRSNQTGRDSQKKQ